MESTLSKRRALGILIVVSAILFMIAAWKPDGKEFI